MQAGRKARIAGGDRIVADPKVDAAVRGKENGVVRDEVVMNPARRCANSEADEGEGRSRSFGKQNTARVSRPVPLEEERDKEKWHEKQNRSNPHRREPDQRAQQQRLKRSGRVAAAHDLPNNEPKNEDEAGRRHENGGVSFFWKKKSPAQSR